MWAAPNAPIRPTALVAFVMADNKEQGLQRIGEVDERMNYITNQELGNLA